jgi:polo-like kinase 1
VTNDIGENFAPKATSKEALIRPEVMHKYRCEVAIHRSLDHPNIVRFADFFEDFANTYMVLELCSGHSVSDMIRPKGRLDEQETAKILRDVISGVCYLHDNRIIHRDVKLQNFLIGDDRKVRIGDFGLSAMLGYDDERMYSLCGTPNYLSPEMVSSSLMGHSYDVDSWAIGVCAFAMLTGRPLLTRGKERRLSILTNYLSFLVVTDLFVLSQFSEGAPCAL